MPIVAILAPLVPFFAMLPLAVAGMYIANRYFRSREGGSQLKQELEALREGRRELPKS